MFRTLLVTTLVLIAQLAISQTRIMYFSTDDSHCATDAITEEYFRAHPEARIAFSERQAKIFKKAAQRSAARSGEIEPFVIPVVIHVVHDNGIGNINKEQIDDAMLLLNETFRRTNKDTNLTRDIFKPYAGVAPFEFRLARLDENGQATDGVHRVNDANNTYNMRDDVKDAVPAWNTRKYFNIWLVNSIRSSGGGTVLGYAQFPSSGNNNYFGIVMRHDQFGRLGTSQADGMTLPHEMGHCLGLYHTFQSGCGSYCDDSGDGICDTPPVAGSSQGCSHTQNSCFNDNYRDTYEVNEVEIDGELIRTDTIQLQPYWDGSDTTDDYPDQIENYMSYNSCQNMFTVGQINVMIEEVQDYSRLRDLYDSTNLSETGVSTLYEADFTTSRNILCTGSEVNFTDISYYGVKEWDWTLPGATPSSSTEKYPSVVYDTPGLYTARLSVTNDLSTKVKTKENHIMVNPKYGHYYPNFSEDYEGGVFPSGLWVGENQEDDNVAWEISNSGFQSNHGMTINNFGNTSGNIDILYSSTYDMSPFESGELTFRYAFAKQDNADADRMIVSYSNDCGENWTNFVSINSSTLPTTTNVTGTEFIPADSDWQLASYNMVPGMLSEDFQIRFTFIAGGGNNLYLDDINFNVTWKDKPVLQEPRSGDVIDALDVDLDWKSLEGLDSYEYEVAEDVAFTKIIASGTTNYIGLDPSDTDTEAEVLGLGRGKLYFWRVRGIKSGTPTAWSDQWFFQISQTVGDEGVARPAEVKARVYPNPTDGETHLRLSVDRSSETTVRLNDLSGRTVKMIQDQTLSAGTHDLVLNLSDLTSGIYLLQIESGDTRIVERVIKE